MRISRSSERLCCGAAVRNIRRQRVLQETSRQIGGLIMQRLTQCAMMAVGLALTSASLPASAQENVRLRATIEKVDGPVYTVKNRDGTEWKLTVSDPPLYVAIAPATMADIKPGMFIGSAGMMRDDGVQKAIEEIGRASCRER